MRLPQQDTLTKLTLASVLVFCLTASVAVGLLCVGSYQVYSYAQEKRPKIDSLLFNLSNVAYNANGTVASLKEEVQEREDRARTVKSLNTLLASLTRNSQDFNQQTLPKVTEGIASLAVASQNVATMVARTDASLNNTEDGILPFVGKTINNLNHLAETYQVRSDEILAEVLRSAEHTSNTIVGIEKLLGSNEEKINEVFTNFKLSSEALVAMSNNGVIASEQLPAFAKETVGTVTEVKSFVAGLNRQQKVSFIVGVLIQAARSALMGM